MSCVDKYIPSEKPHYWNQYSGGPKHQGASTICGPSRLSLLWMLDPNGRSIDSSSSDWTATINTSPVIDRNGVVYIIEKQVANPQMLSHLTVIPHFLNTLVAVNAEGSELWRSKPLGAANWEWLALDSNGNIYHASFGCLTAFSPSSTLLWQYESHPMGDGLIISDSGYIFVGAASDEKIKAGYRGQCDLILLLDIKGKKKKVLSVGLWSSLNLPAIDSMGRVVLAQRPFKLTIANPSSDDVESFRLHSASTGFPANCPMVASDNSIWLAFDHGLILHANTCGILLGAVQLPFLVEEKSDSQLGVDRRAVITPTTISLLDGEEVLVTSAYGSWVISSDHKLNVFPESEPELGQGQAVLVDSVGTVYICKDRIITAISRTGEKLWAYESKHEESFQSQPVIGLGGVLYVLSDHSRLYAFGQ